MRAKAKGRYHNAAGVAIPSVTTVLSVLNKPALVRWANRLGLQGIDVDKYKDDLADIGTLTHLFIMCRLKQEQPDTSDYTPNQVRLAEACYQKYADWEARNPINPIMVEQHMVSEKYQYGGTFDLYSMCVKDLLLSDFKTNAKGIFPEMVYQVSAYRQLLVEAGYPVTKVNILRLGRDELEGADEKILTEVELDVSFKIFLHCLELYKLTRGGTV